MPSAASASAANSGRPMAAGIAADVRRRTKVAGVRPPSREVHVATVRSARLAKTSNSGSIGSGSVHRTSVDVTLAHLDLGLGQRENGTEGGQQVLLMHLRQRLGIQQAGLHRTDARARAVHSIEAVEVVDGKGPRRHQAGTHAWLVALEADGVQAAVIDVQSRGATVGLVRDLQRAGALLLRHRLQLGHHLLVEDRP